jgi:uncharacterized damage-inducible protein DinB
MNRFALLLFVSSFLATAPRLTTAQEANASFADEFLRQFDASSQKLVALASAIPADKFSWSPGEDVMSIERVYLHIARYNYNYPVNNFGMEAPQGIDLGGMEELKGKEQVLASLTASADFVRECVAGLSEQNLHQKTELYGRDVEKWAVLFQLVAHMNEHLGQSIAYARMNDVVPPWSR